MELCVKTCLFSFVLFVVNIFLFIYLISNKEQYTTVNFKPSETRNDIPVQKTILKKRKMKDTLLKKQVSFDEFDQVNIKKTPVGHLYQASVVNKYDPKYVDVFKTAF